MVNNPRGVIQKAFKWIQLIINSGNPSLQFRILATFLATPHLTCNLRRIKWLHIWTNLCIPWTITKQTQFKNSSKSNKWEKNKDIFWEFAKVPVTQETHIEVGEDIAKAICSGKFEVTFFFNLGWFIGKSSLPLRSDGSKRRVTGGNGPSRVVGMRLSVTKILVRTKQMLTGIHGAKFFIGLLYVFCLPHLLKMVQQWRKLYKTRLINFIFGWQSLTSFIGIWGMGNWNMLFVFWVHEYIYMYSSISPLKWGSPPSTVRFQCQLF